MKVKKQNFYFEYNENEELVGGDVCLLSLFWPTFQSLIYELVDEDGCSSSFDISTRITQCAGFSSIRMYDDHDEVSHWVKSEESEDCKHVFF